MHAFAFAVPREKLGSAFEIPPLTVQGQQAWKKLFAKGYVVADEFAEGGKLTTLDNSELVVDTLGGTGPLNPGESSSGSLTLIVPERVGDYIGFRCEIRRPDPGFLPDPVRPLGTVRGWRTISAGSPGRSGILTQAQTNDRQQRRRTRIRHALLP